LAELDLIEVVERTKADYESDVEEPPSPTVKSSNAHKDASSDSALDEPQNLEQLDSDRSE